MRRQWWWLAVLPLAVEAATLQDFADGLRLEPQPGYAVQDLALPETVYTGVAGTDLSDLRVFNAAGAAVPYALCPPASAAAAAQTRSLALFPLRSGERAQAAGTHLEIRAADGTELRVTGTPAGTAEPAVTAYIADTGEPAATNPPAIQPPIQALRIRWQPRDGASEAQLRILGSTDLDHWQVLVAEATLVQAQNRDTALAHDRIALPDGPQRYLRLESAQGRLPVIDAITAESAGPAVAAEWVDFSAPLERHSDAGGTTGFAYRGRPAAPVAAATIELPQANMALDLALDSRSDAGSAWVARWSGTVSSASAADLPQQYPRFAPVHAQAWRLRVLRGADSLGGEAPRLHLAYRPAHLRFMTQGPTPYVLAFGSRRAGADAALLCRQLTPQPARWGQAQATPATGAVFGGAEALRPRPRPVDRMRLVLWATLIGGAALLLFLALRLLRQLRHDTPP